MVEKNKDLENCKLKWQAKDETLSYCPIHDHYFYTNKGARVCKYYDSTGNEASLISNGKEAFRENNSTPNISHGNHKVCKETFNQHAKNQVCGSANIGSFVAGIDNSTPVWVNDVNEDVADIRSHAFTFKININNPRNWSIKNRILEAAGFKVLPKGGVAATDMIFFKGYKIWLSKHKITVYFPDYKQYWVDAARTGYNYAVADLVTLLQELEHVLSSDFRINKEYKFNVSRQHHALVQNSLAKQYNRKHEKLEVYDKKGELWLLIDNSDVHNIRMNDLEGVHVETGPVDMDHVVKPFFNDLRDTKLMPSDIINMFKNVADIQRSAAEMQRVSAEKESFYAEQHASHVGAIRQLGDMVGKLDQRIARLSKLQSPVKKQSKADKIRKLKDKWW